MAVQPRPFSSLMIFAIFSALQTNTMPSGFMSRALTTSGPKVTASVGTSTFSTVMPRPWSPFTCASAMPGHGP